MTAWTTYLKPCEEEYFKTAVSCHYLHESHFRREACLGEKGGNDRCCVSAGGPVLVQHRAAPSLNALEESSGLLRSVRICGRAWAVSEPQRLLHGLLGDLVKALAVIPPHLGSIHVGSAFVVGL